MGTFSLEVLEAKHGDALLLHYGKTDDPRLAVIDGGPAGVYGDRLGPRLLAIRDARKAADLLRDGLLEIRLLATTHVDEDHIAGVLELVKKGCIAPKTRFCDVLTLWHNSFGDAVADADLDSVPDPEPDPAGGAVATSVAQGRTLRAQANALHWFVNHPFSGFVRSDDPRARWAAGSGLTLTVLAPGKGALAELQTRWKKEVEDLLEKNPGVTVAEAGKRLEACTDDSVFNLASLAMLAEFEGKRMLLLGDARADHVVEGLEAAGLLADGTFPVDVLKMPHHGSFYNINEDLLRRVPSAHYVFSANGKHGHPHAETLKLLIDVRGADAYTMHFTNHVPHADAFLASVPAGGNFRVEYREDDAPGLRIDLGDAPRF